MLKMTIDNEEVLSNNDISIKEEILSPSSTILNNVYPKSWELDKDYVSRFYYPKDYSKLNIQNFSIEPEEVGKTIQVNGSATLTDVDTSKESRVLRLLGQTSQTGTPTPSSPIPINVVSGDNEIDICGKNLLPNNATSQTMNGITFTINSDKSITINGTARGRADLYIYGQSTDNGNYVKIPKGIYSIDTSKITNGKLFYMFREKTAGTTFATPSNSSAISLMSSQDCYFYGIVLAVENGVTLNNYTIYPMLEKGNQATTYEPYIGHSYPIYLGVENLFDGSLIGNWSGVGISITQEGQEVILSGTPTRDWGNTSRKELPITLKAGETYYLSSNSNIKTRLWLYTSSTASTIGSNVPYNTSFTPSEDLKYFSFVYEGLTLGQNYNETFTLQIEKGSKQNSFTPYGTTPIELCKIPNTTYQDYIYKDNGSWYLHKEIGKVVLDGSETGWSKSSTTNIDRFYIELQKGYLDSYNRLLAYSNYYKYTTNLNVFEVGNMQMGSYQQNTRLFLDYSVYNTTTLEQFKTWLSTHNTIVYYVLTTPTNTEITDTTLLEQLESLSS